MSGYDIYEKLRSGYVLDIEGKVSHLLVAGMQDVESGLPYVVDKGNELLVALARRTVVDRLYLSRKGAGYIAAIRRAGNLDFFPCREDGGVCAVGQIESFQHVSHNAEVIEVAKTWIFCRSVALTEDSDRNMMLGGGSSRYRGGWSS